jgi:hypothetical protein
MVQNALLAVSLVFTWGCSVAPKPLPGVVEPRPGKVMASIQGPMASVGAYATVDEAISLSHEKLAMKRKLTALLLGIVVLSCVHSQDDWRQHQDRSIRMPRFDASTKVDLVVDGAMLQALRIAADDFLPPTTKPRACSDTQAAHDFEVRRDGDIIFVRISEVPERCGEKYQGLDGAVWYAISKDGRILRRIFDGEPESVELPARPDGGAPRLDSRVHWDWSLTPPWLLDGGAPSPAPDAGISSPP